MSLKIALRAQVCQFLSTPSYPLEEFLQWTSRFELGPKEVLGMLDELQVQLEVEAQALRRHGKSAPGHLLQQQYWCFYCEQVRSYYRTVLKHPELEKHLMLT